MDELMQEGESPTDGQPEQMSAQDKQERHKVGTEGGAGHDGREVKSPRRPEDLPGWTGRGQRTQ
jgi:hypothetical protein